MNLNFINLMEEVMTSTIAMYSESVLNRQISFDRAVKEIHFATKADEYLIEDALSEHILKVCPLRDQTT